MPRTAVLFAFYHRIGFAGNRRPCAPGGLDGNGCHHESDTGRYHCPRTVKGNTNVKALAKESRENICHGPTSPNYTTLRYFIAFETMEARLESGGHAFGS